MNLSIKSFMRKNKKKKSPKVLGSQAYQQRHIQEA
jgi:hypothetical protein